MLKFNFIVLFINYKYKINIYKIFLYIIIRIISLNIIYYIAFTFLLAKTVNNHSWVFDIFKKLYKFFDISNLKIIIIDAKFSIIYTILKKFLLIFYLLYL